MKDRVAAQLDLARGASLRPWHRTRRERLAAARVERLRARDRWRHAHALDQHAHVGVVREVARRRSPARAPGRRCASGSRRDSRVEQGRQIEKRVPDGMNALASKLICGVRHRQEVELQIGPRLRRARAHEPAALRARSRPAARCRAARTAPSQPSRLNGFTLPLTRALSLCPTIAIRWSCRFLPTPGRSCDDSTPACAARPAGPMPDSSSSCGEPIAPPHRITSRSARALLLSAAAR